MLLQQRVSSLEGQLLSIRGDFPQSALTSAVASKSALTSAVTPSQRIHYEAIISDLQSQLANISEAQNPHPNPSGSDARNPIPNPAGIDAAIKQSTQQVLEFLQSYRLGFSV